MSEDTRIPASELVIGGIYRIHARNFLVGIYTGQGFVGSREKMGRVFLFEEYLMEEPGEPHRITGTAFAWERLGKSSYLFMGAGEEKFYTLNRSTMEALASANPATSTMINRMLCDVVMALLASAQEMCGRWENERFEYEMRKAEFERAVRMSTPEGKAEVEAEDAAAKAEARARIAEMRAKQDKGE